MARSLVRLQRTGQADSECMCAPSLVRDRNECVRQNLIKLKVKLISERERDWRVCLFVCLCTKRNANNVLMLLCAHLCAMLWYSPKWHNHFVRVYKNQQRATTVQKCSYPKMYHSGISGISVYFDSWRLMTILYCTRFDTSQSKVHVMVHKLQRWSCEQTDSYIWNTP